MPRIFALLCLMLLPVLAQAAGDPRIEIEYAGLDRSYLLHMPSPLPNDPLPLVVVLHGGGGSAESAAKMTGFDAEADKEGFIVVYPNGTGKARPFLNALGKPGFLTWNAGSCCGYAYEKQIDDVGFIRALVVQVIKDNAADPKRVYVTGISNGGMMAYRLACEASDLFAAIAPVSAVQEVASCKPSQPVSVFHIHGAKDENVPLDGGVGKKAIEKEDRKPVQDSIDFWVRQDGCSVTVHSQEPDVLMTNYGGCQAGSEVSFFLIQDGGHAWPGGQRIARFLDPPSRALDATSEIWDFFKSHSKP
ncbi:MAG TPA: PHB depolymerase family esterase [Gammaproteobacteria bacterium]|nr:PHB depolymerase family esterase [Gammaproteobacteria bacterium]